MGEHKRNDKRLITKLKKAKLGITAFIIFMVVGWAVYFQLANHRENSPFSFTDPARTKGSDEAPLQILEFIDFQCQECKRGNNVLREYFAQFPEGLSLSVKYFPLGQLNSTVSAIYAQCAAKQDKFWPFYEELIHRQDEWRPLLNIEVIFNIMAKDAELDTYLLGLCVNDPEIKTVVLKDQLLGESWGVRITPTYFINDEMIVGVEALESALEGFFKDQTDVYY